tara:strand:- start:2768 stop:3610 length:843 start_codon:yes stop_codon:yes gene_type:complete
MFLINKISIFFVIFYSILFPVESISSEFAKVSNKRIISLNSLGADIVSKLEIDSLVGIPGSTLLKKDDKFTDKVIISEGRMPPSLEKIIKLKPTLVIGSEGFHDKILDKLNELNVETLRTNTRSINQLEILISDLANYLNKDPSKLNTDIKNCYLNLSKTRGSAVILASTKPLLSPNSNSWAGKLLDRFNFDNISKDLEAKTEFRGYVNLSPEIILKTKPSKIIVISFPGSNQISLLSDPVLGKLISKGKSELFTFDYYGLINPGSLKTINNACEKLSNI